VHKLSQKFSPCLKNSQIPHPSSVIVVHEFIIGDVEDPDLYAGQSLWEFQQSEKGQWVMKHALETPIWHRQQDYLLYRYKYKITAKLLQQDITYFLLRWN
jgi:hypothetical protein